MDEWHRVSKPDQFFFPAPRKTTMDIHPFTLLRPCHITILTLNTTPPIFVLILDIALHRFSYSHFTMLNKWVAYVSCVLLPFFLLFTDLILSLHNCAGFLFGFPNSKNKLFYNQPDAWPSTCKNLDTQKLARTNNVNNILLQPTRPIIMKRAKRDTSAVPRDSFDGSRSTPRRSWSSIVKVEAWLKPWEPLIQIVTIQCRFTLYIYMFQT